MTWMLARGLDVGIEDEEIAELFLEDATHVGRLNHSLTLSQELVVTFPSNVARLLRIILGGLWVKTQSSMDTKRNPPT